jgi:hypothetical protein
MLVEKEEIVLVVVVASIDKDVIVAVHKTAELRPAIEGDELVAVYKPAELGQRDEIFAMGEPVEQELTTEGEERWAVIQLGKEERNAVDGWTVCWRVEFESLAEQAQDRSPLRDEIVEYCEYMRNTNVP